MQFLNNLISKIGIFVFFIFLEIAALFITATRSDFHQNVIGQQTLAVKGFLTDKTNYITHFLDTPRENEILAKENAMLKQKLAAYQNQLATDSLIQRGTEIDSTYREKFTYTQARIVDYSLDKRDNYFLINKGYKDGIREGMGVLSPQGIVGTVLGTGNHYASVLSVLHSKSYIKARVKGQSRFGIIVWSGDDFKELSLTEIPKYLEVGVGDTIVTAGASAAFPEGELIGRVKSLKPNDTTGDYDITVQMFDDLSKVSNVYVIENLDKLDIEKAKAEEDVITK